ncbi:carboxymuconolactone decarboxylase family protein [Alcaligenes sp. WGS1538]|uniref:carboxymuconolactone decarboxylase family protein n=1 Tax=Alcaligenes sp. WGS1538 TaxID=3366811 RepID=UPI00372CF6D3
MSRLSLPEPAQAPAASQPALQDIQKAFGAVPAMFRTVSLSPAALRSMWGSFGALGSGTLGARLGEQLAVAIADRNRCEYCLAAHTALGGKAGLSEETLAKAQKGQSDDPRTAAALAFVLKLVDKRGQVSEADVQAVRQAGFDEGQVVELIAVTALNLFTNYVNVALDVPVDFKAVELTA